MPLGVVENESPLYGKELRLIDKVRVREKILWVRTLGDCLVARRIRRLAGDDPSRRREPEREWRRKIPLGCAPEATVLSSVASSGKTRGRWPFEKGVGTGKAQGPPPGKAQRPPHAEAHAGGEGSARIFVHRHEPAGGPVKSNRRQPSTYARACQYTTPSSGREKRQKVDQDL